MRGTEDVFELAGGPSGLAWHLVRWLYRKGASPGVVNRIYHSLRRSNDYNSDSFGLRLLGRSIKERLPVDGNQLIVSHPILVGVFRGRPGLVYQHGELIAPQESIVRGAELVIVPTPAVGRSFHACGYPVSSVFESGLCIEPALVKQAEDSLQLRLGRYAGGGPLTAAIFSSGAEPREHVLALVQIAARMILTGHRVIIFAQRGKSLARSISKAFDYGEISLSRVSATDMIADELPKALLVEFDSRREETTLTARLFPAFDFLVAPSHERSNWAVGLGLPMFILEPCIGPFAPMNRDLLLDHRVAVDLNSREDVLGLPERVESLRNRGELAEMARNGWGKYPIDGFARIGELLFERSQR